MRITRFFTQKLGQNSYVDNREEIKKILIIRPNHRLGNMLLITPFIEEVATIFPQAKIDLFVKGGAASQVFKNHSKIHKIYALPKNHFKKFINYLGVWTKLIFKKYDLAINISNESSSGNLATKISSAKYKFFGTESYTSSKPDDYNHFAKFPIYNFREYLNKSGIQINTQEICKLILVLNNQEIANGKEIINAITKNTKKNIVLFTYATGNKCYSKEFWLEFYKKINEKFQNSYNIIEVLPVENISQLNFSIPTFYSKDIREIAAFFQNVEVFIGADSGMMHLAATATKTIGLFKNDTKMEIYQPFGNTNLGINTSKKSIEDCIAIVKTSLSL